MITSLSSNVLLKVAQRHLRSVRWIRRRSLLISIWCLRSNFAEILATKTLHLGFIEDHAPKTIAISNKLRWATGRVNLEPQCARLLSGSEHVPCCCCCFLTPHAASFSREPCWATPVPLVTPSRQAVDAPLFRRCSCPSIYVRRQSVGRSCLRQSPLLDMRTTFHYPDH